MTSSTRVGLSTSTSVWWAFAVVGVVTLGVGIFLVAAPHETLTTLTVITGILLLVDGVFAVFGSIFGEVENRGLLALVGVLGAIAGLILIKKPFGTLLVFALIFGVWFVVVGIVRFVSAFTSSENRASNILLSIVEVIAGIVVLSWPELALSTLAIIVGIVLILRGLLFTYGGFRLRRLRGALDDSPAAPSMS